MNITRLTIGKRLGLGFGVVTLLFGGATIVTLGEVSTIQSQAGVIDEQVGPQLQTATEAERLSRANTQLVLQQLNLTDLRNSLGSEMWRNVGIQRDRAGLHLAVLVRRGPLRHRREHRIPPPEGSLRLLLIAVGVQGTLMLS